MVRMINSMFYLFCHNYIFFNLNEVKKDLYEGVNYPME